MGVHVLPSRKAVVFPVYVGDFKMAGLAKNLSGAWKELGRHLELDPPTEIDGAVYLGQTQINVKVDQRLVDAQQLRWKDLFSDLRVGEYDASGGNLTAKDQRHKAENPVVDVEIVMPNGIPDPDLDHLDGDTLPNVVRAKEKKPKGKNKGQRPKK